MAACVAEAFNPDATVNSIIDTALTLAKEGTRSAIAAVVDCARSQSDWQSAIGPLRQAMRPFDGAADDFHNRGNGSDDWNPSRTHSIEEVPIALGFLVVTDGDYEHSIFGGANYGRDCDSIAGMAGSISGALHGAGAIRSGWIQQVNEANRIDMSGSGSRPCAPCECPP